jgi:site-specific recombinase XerD
MSNEISNDKIQNSNCNYEESYTNRLPRPGGLLPVGRHGAMTEREETSNKAEYLVPDVAKKQPLFLSSRGQRLNVRGIERMVSKYAKVAGITKNVSPHTLRHTFATDLLIAGADIRSVQSLLGHSNISTTQVYTHMTDQHLREVHQKFHNQQNIEEEQKQA